MPNNELQERANTELAPVIKGQLTAEESTPLLMSFLKKEEANIRKRHDEGVSGLEIVGARAKLLDTLLSIMFNAAIARHKGESITVTLVAQGGYGRGDLNPNSDLDLLFLLPRASHQTTEKLSTIIQEVLYILWDSGFKVGHACRSIAECISEARKDQQSKTSLMDVRYISGDEKLFQTLCRRFDKECIHKGQQAFFDLRRADLRRRHGKYSHTVFLQEPHVKESCGGLRDYQNILWVARVKRGFKSLEELVDAKIITKSTCRQLQEGYDFLHRVRNELHYETGRSTDTLTLRFQGIVATNFTYPQKSILRRCEFFMRDYYRHTRAIYTHCTSLMEFFEIEHANKAHQGLRWLLPFSGNKNAQEKFDGFVSRDGRIYLENINIFKEDPNSLMRVFQHCQIRSLSLSPQARKYIHRASKKIDRAFRYDKANRETFRAILERKGEVARILRLMHRTKVLDNYLPEFGAMDCLVQHEFFHRYTADEHTLRCIDQLDSLTEVNPDDTSHGTKLFRKLLHEVQDPYAVYLALILHDSGRAENVREHIDGSTMLADKVCHRLQIRSGRRALIMFLVDHHLTFWRFATSRNLDDLAVIEEFAGLMKDRRNLEALLLFTWADSNGTNDEAWSPWKETLMLQLYHATKLWLKEGKDQFKSTMSEHKASLQENAKKLLPKSHHEELKRHFELMPVAYFRFRAAENIAIHIKSVYNFFQEDSAEGDNFCCDMSWIERSNRSHTELLTTAWNRPLLLEKLCCALAAEEINIIAADVYTRRDSLVCDLFQVCTKELEPVTNTRTRERVLKTFKSINSNANELEDYNAAKYLKPKPNLLRNDSNEGGIPFPTRVYVSNELSPTCTGIEIQALDRIGLLHDLLYSIGEMGMATVHARICTEKGAAMDTIYVTWPDGSKIEDEEKHHEIRETLQKLIS